MKYVVWNEITDNTLRGDNYAGGHEGATPTEAIDNAYRAHGWKDFADARVGQQGTAAQEYEIVARQIDESGNEIGPVYGYDGAPR